MSQKLRIDLPLLLPDIPSAADACVERLLQLLRARRGVENVHVKLVDGEESAQLCIHYDSQELSLNRIREITAAAGAEISNQFGHASWQLDGVVHQRRASTISNRLLKLPGVLEVNADASGLMQIEFDRSLVAEQAILEKLREFGVSPRDGSALPVQAAPTHKGLETNVGQKADEEDHKHHEHGPGEHASHRHGGIFGANTEMIFALICGVLLGAGVLVEKISPEAPAAWSLACYIGAYFFGGFYTLREAIDNLRLKRFEIDTLMLVAAAGAATLGSWAEGALLSSPSWCQPPSWGSASAQPSQSTRARRFLSFSTR